MILTSNGQNIYPEEIEAKLNNMPFVMESLIVERDGKLVALVCPDYEAMDSYGVSNRDLPMAMEEVRNNLNKMLAPYEQITRIQLYPNEFEKTPKRSIKRYLYDNWTFFESFFTEKMKDSEKKVRLRVQHIKRIYTFVAFLKQKNIVLSLIWRKWKS